MLLIEYFIFSLFAGELIYQNGNTLPVLLNAAWNSVRILLTYLSTPSFLSTFTTLVVIDAHYASIDKQTPLSYAHRAEPSDVTTTDRENTECDKLSFLSRLSETITVSVGCVLCTVKLLNSIVQQIKSAIMRETTSKLN